MANPVQSEAKTANYIPCIPQGELSIRDFYHLVERSVDAQAAARRYTLADLEAAARSEAREGGRARLEEILSQGPATAAGPVAAPTPDLAPAAPAAAPAPVAASIPAPFNLSEID